MTEEKEVWKDVVGYEGIYMVSNIGNVKSVGRGGGRIQIPVHTARLVLKNG